MADPEDDIVEIPSLNPGEDDIMDCIEITPEHIRANGTMHTTPFAGLAELIDNAVDSGAKSVLIESRKVPHSKIGTERFICVIDDGVGMDRKEALSTILLGYSIKRGNINSIGQFGNGLKSGSMRLGDTMLLVTKKTVEGREEYTLLLIALNYLDDIKAIKCYAPCISLRYTDNNQFDKIIMEGESVKKHNHALSIMLKYSPFNTEELLFDFVRTAFSGDSGTCVAISDLKRIETGKYEMRFSKEDSDFLLDGRDKNKSKEGLGKFLQTLYLQPRITIRIHDKMVCLVDPKRSLMERRWSFLSPQGLANFTKRETEHLETQIKKLTGELGTKTHEMKMLSKRVLSTEERYTLAEQKTMNRDLRMLETEKMNLEKQVEEIKKRKDKIKSSKPGSDLKVYMGIDLINRYGARIVFYSNGRRIMTMELDKNARRKMEVLGVVCIIDIPSTLLPTAMNRENYETPTELTFLTGKINNIAKTYFQYVNHKYKTEEFWSSLGYTDDPSSIGCSEEPQLRKALMMMGMTKMCFRCRNFREVDLRPEWALPLPSLDLVADAFRCDVVIGTPRTCEPITREEREISEIKELSKKGKGSKYAKAKKKEVKENATWADKDKEDAKLLRDINPPSSSALSGSGSTGMKVPKEEEDESHFDNSRKRDSNVKNKEMDRRSNSGEDSSDEEWGKPIERKKKGKNTARKGAAPKRRSSSSLKKRRSVDEKKDEEDERKTKDELAQKHLMEREKRKKKRDGEEEEEKESENEDEEKRREEEEKRMDKGQKKKDGEMEEEEEEEEIRVWEEPMLESEKGEEREEKDRYSINEFDQNMGGVEMENIQPARPATPPPSSSGNETRRNEAVQRGMATVKIEPVNESPRKVLQQKVNEDRRGEETARKEKADDELSREELIALIKKKRAENKKNREKVERGREKLEKKKEKHANQLREWLKTSRVTMEEAKDEKEMKRERQDIIESFNAFEELDNIMKERERRRRRGGSERRLPEVKHEEEA